MHDEKFMRAALREAARGLGHTSPNPAVGAVVVRGGRVIARGFHQRAGLPHAEIEALRALKNPALARGATIYVTLEPCSTHGRTPPCVDAIIRAGFARVVIGATDPNPAHAGRGIGLLRAAGIAVTAGVLESECRELNAGFNKWIVTRLPLVIAKAGMSLDGGDHADLHLAHRRTLSGKGFADRLPAAHAVFQPPHHAAHPAARGLR